LATTSEVLAKLRRGEEHRLVEEHRRLSFIAFGGPHANAGLSPGWAS